MEYRNVWCDGEACDARDDCLKGPIIIVQDLTLFNYLQAADYFNVSPNYFVSNLASRLPLAIDGKWWSQKRWYFKDLQAEKLNIDIQRHKAMNELTELSEEMGLYE